MMHRASHPLAVDAARHPGAWLGGVSLPAGAAPV